MIHKLTHRVVAVPDAERVDHGARGPANQARPARLIETISAGVRLRCFGDVHLIDKMLAAKQLTDREFKAAEIAAYLHDEANFEPSTTAGYDPAGGRSHVDETDEPMSVTRFRKLLAGNGGGELSPVGAWLLHGLMLGQHPGPQRIGTLRCALSGLAKRWGC